MTRLTEIEKLERQARWAAAREEMMRARTEAKREAESAGRPIVMGPDPEHSDPHWFEHTEGAQTPESVDLKPADVLDLFGATGKRPTGTIESYDIPDGLDGFGHIVPAPA